MRGQLVGQGNRSGQVGETGGWAGGYLGGGGQLRGTAVNRWKGVKTGGTVEGDRWVGQVGDSSVLPRKWFQQGAGHCTFLERHH